MNNLKKVRLIRGLKQSEFISLLREKGVVKSQSSIAKVENGNYDMSGQSWLAASKVLDCDLHMLLGDIDLEFKAVARGDKNER